MHHKEAYPCQTLPPPMPIMGFADPNSGLLQDTPINKESNLLALKATSQPRISKGDIYDAASIEGTLFWGLREQWSDHI